MKVDFISHFSLKKRILLQSYIHNKNFACQSYIFFIFSGFKLYFDAKLLEVISVCEETRINSDHPTKSNCSDLALQWELNHFMLRWLDYCIHRYNGATWQKSN